MPKIWVTRSQPAADQSTAKLSAKGFDAVAAPLIKITPPVSRSPRLPREAHLIITSKNGVTTLADSTEARHWPVITVGDATAEAARDAGFSDVISASGTSADVLTLVRSLALASNRPVIHVSGTKARGQITETLQSEGYAAERHIYYASRPVASVPALDMSDISHVLLYSPLAAKTLQAFDPDLSGAMALSISRETDAALEGLTVGVRMIAAMPTENSLLSLLD